MAEAHGLSLVVAKLTQVLRGTTRKAVKELHVEAAL